MKKKKEAVAIARDVLAQLAAEKIVSNSAGYLDAEKMPTSESLQVALENEEMGTCSVCAKGAAFLSYVRLYNQVKTKDITETILQSTSLDLTPGFIELTLNKYFSHVELDYMEYIYECGDAGTLADLLGEWADYDDDPEGADIDAELAFIGYDPRAVARMRDHSVMMLPADDRLAWIFRNIVQNNGTFTI